MANRLLLVGNPSAQSGKNQERIDRALALFAEGGVTPVFFATLPNGATIDALRRHLDAHDFDTVVAMGGDGTFREVGAGILLSTKAKTTAMGMLPTGTANDQGKSFGLAATAEALATNVAIVLAKHETKLDAGHIATFDDAGNEISRATFFDSAGWGISARVLAVRNEDRKVVETLGPLKEVYRDHLVYAGAFLRTFAESYVIDDKFSVVVESEGKSESITGLIDLVVKGTRVYGGAWVFDPTSAHNDGVFEIIPFRGKRDWTSKAIVGLDGMPLTEADLNAIGVEHSKPLRAHDFTLRFQPPKDVPLHAQIDGEEFPCGTVVQILVEREALRLIVPERSPDA